GRMLRSSPEIITYDTSYIKELTQKNEVKFFKPARQSIKLARRSLKEWNQKNYELAIETMSEAYNIYKHKEIQFNLGKMHLAEGKNYEAGVIHLLEYYQSTNDFDFHKMRLKNLLLINETRRTMEGRIKGGDN